MLTPDERLGLAGRSLDGRVRRALHALPPIASASLQARLEREARADGLVYERDDRIETIRVMARPLVMLPDQFAYLHHVTLQIIDALEQLPELYLTDPHVRRTVPLGPDEEAFLREVHRPGHDQHDPLYPRLDAVVELPSARWRDTLKYVEANLGGVGGIHIAPTAENLVWRNVVPVLRDHDPGLQLSMPRDQRQLFLQALVDHQRAVGRGDGAIALLEPKYVSGGPVEQSHLVRHLHELFGVELVTADPRDLRLQGGEVWVGDHKIDVAYRDYEVRDLLAAAREDGVDLEPIKTLFRENRMVSSLGGEFDHKSAFELLTDPDFADRAFSPEERRLFQKHVSWTRLVYEREVTLPDRRVVDLLAWARASREDLVLKPNRGYGGAGILIGPSVTQSEWEAALEVALAGAGDAETGWVVQQLAELPVHEFPVVDELGHVHDEPFYTVMGFAPTSGGMGVLCRVSQKKVVNVAQRGGVVAVLLGESPQTLRGPPAAPATEQVEQALRAEIRTLRHLDAAVDLLEWDEEVCLPAGAREERGGQLATLESLRHGKLASPWLGDLLLRRRAELPAGSDEALELDHLLRRRRDALAVPDDLVRAFAEARSASHAAWEEARRRRDFRVWLPAFTTLLDRVRDRGQALARGGDAYDALLDQFDPGSTRATVTPLLTGLRDALVPLVARHASDGPLPAWRQRPVWPDAAQEKLCREILASMGLDFTRGRLDRAIHPFTLQAGNDDVRLTIRVFEHDPLPAVFGTLHEGGHALYDQGYAEADRGTLLAEAPSMGLHESQARLWENRVGRGRPFWTAFFRRVRDLFPEGAGLVSLDAWLAEITRVRRSPIRVDADELTYDLHILLRYRLELALIDGALRPADLPAAWNEGMRDLLDLVPEDDLKGCLQDVHWAIGSFGYFPSYTLGNLYAAQLWQAWLRDRRDGEDEIAAGRLGPLLHWLRANVHRRGRRMGAAEVVRRATGTDPSHRALVEVLSAR